MKLVLLGKDGQVGRALGRTLPALGELVAWRRAEADLAEPERLAALVRAQRPEVIINAGAYTAVDKAESERERAERINGEAPARLAAVARELGALLVHYSTDYVYDGHKPEPYVETDPARPLSAYGASKLAGDEAILGSGGRHLVLRVSWVYAPGHNNFPAAMLKLGRDRQTLNVVADQVGAPTSAALIAEVTAEAIRQMTAPGAPDRSGLYHLAAAGTVSRDALARFVLSEARARGLPLALTPDGVRPIRTADYPTPAQRPLNSRLDTSKLRDAFGITLPAWEDDMRRFVDETVGAAA